MNCLSRASEAEAPIDAARRKKTAAGGAQEQQSCEFHKKVRKRWNFRGLMIERSVRSSRTCDSAHELSQGLTRLDARHGLAPENAMHHRWIVPEMYADAPRRPAVNENEVL
jgi:hypothetical protein